MVDSSSDPRVAYVANVAASIFANMNLAGKIAQSAEVQSFVNQIGTKSMLIITKDDKIKILIDQVAEVSDDYLNAHFIKINAGSVELTPQNMSQEVLVTTVRGGSLNSLYSQMSKIYHPLYKGGQDEKGDSTMRDMISALQLWLRRGINGQKTSLSQDLKNFDFKETDFTGIVSPELEIEAWEEVLNSAKQADLQRKADLIVNHFKSISGPLAELQSMEIGQVYSLIDNTGDALDKIWCDPQISPPYPQQRMVNMFKVTSKAIGSRVEKLFSECEVWKGTLSEVRVRINECIRICNNWKQKMSELTKTFWRTQDLHHRWEGGAFQDLYLENCIARLNEIFDLRSQHDELMRLLTPEECEQNNVDQTLEPLRKTPCFYTNELAQPMWKRARKEYEQGMEPLIQQICQKLRVNHLSDSKATASQQLREYQRFKHLLHLEQVRTEMKQDRANLLALLVQEVNQTTKEFNARTSGSDYVQGVEKPPQCANVSETVSTIIWTRQVKLKAENTAKVAHGVFGDMPQLDKFKEISGSLVKDINDYEKALFKQWTDNIANDRDKLQMSGQVMEFDFKVGGYLKVNYSDKLVTLVKDARILSENEFKIPSEIQKMCENAKKFYKEGITLKQAANFFNSMGTQMIESQKPMMLEKATQFENLIKTPKGDQTLQGGIVTWSDPVEITQYNKKVQKMATDLIAENRKLKKVHQNVIDLILEWMSLDLLNNRQAWKLKMQQIRGVVESVTAKRSPAHCSIWLSHLDAQLYKALEHQYQMGLEFLNESLTEISTDLVCRDNQLQFKPTIEELKQRYYGEISNFITVPSKFQGLGSSKTSSLFIEMPDQNSDHIKLVYVKAEQLFSELQNVIYKYREWTVLGNIDIKQHIEKYFKGVEDWNSNFEMLRQKRKELKQVTEFVHVQCIRVNMAPFKSGIDQILRQFQDGLVDTMEENIYTDIDKVTNFIQTGMGQLNVNPQSLEEIDQMHQNAIQLGTQKEEYESIFKGLQDKRTMIKQLKGTSINISEVESLWGFFNTRLTQFFDKMEDQKGQLKQQLEKKIKTLNTDLEKMYERWNEKKPKERNELTQEEAMETADIMRELKNTFSELQERITKVTRESELFGLPQPKLQYYDQMKDELVEQGQIWEFFEEFKKKLTELGAEDWIVYRKKGFYAFQDFYLDQAEKLKAIKNKNVVQRFLLKTIEEYKQAWPLIKLCVGESFEKEHWRRLFTILKLPKDVSLDNMKFSHLTDAIPQMIAKQKDIKELSDKAQGEVTIREAINELRVWCESTEFVLSDYTANGRTTPLIKEWKEVMTQVSDNQSLIMSLKESRYFQSFQDQIEQFESRFAGIDGYLFNLNVIQRKWVYLEPIFMRGALPQEQGRFMRVDDEYRTIAQNIGADPKVISLCEIRGLKDTLDTILTQLDMCQKALNDYLEEKRQKFSRFYFIGDDDLLEILGQAQNPAVIQNHLKKLFSGIHKVAFNKDNTQIKSMISSQNEYVELNQPITITGDVEDWLIILENNMRSTLDGLLHKAIGNQDLQIADMPSQICQLVEMLKFNNNSVNAITQGKLENYKGTLQRQLEGYTSFDHKGNHLLFLKVKALIMDIIHYIAVVDELMNDQIVQTKQPNDWMWFKQLRYQMSSQGKLLVGMCDAFFDYTFEYQGNASKLVHTPLTDKCFLTLVMGMKLGYGGNPYGPAGTGKTESVKALGQAFGRQVLVFNCDEGLDYKSMGRIFIGLVKCGAWGCFDEFNRLLEEQLSAISQDIQVIQHAIKENQPQLTLLGRTIQVNKNAGIFVTMNPASKNYGGRSKLPDNLKQLFRPVAMSAPDIELIAEVSLLSEGFKEGKKLSTKIVSLFRLSKQLLSKQQHYDWELRAMKTILGTSGQLVQSEIRAGKKMSFEAEALILIKAIRVNTMSKLTYNDSIKFEALQADMFPGIKSEDIVYEQLTSAIDDTIKELHLQKIDKQIMKIMQFYEATKQRMGVVIVGPSGCGKTTIWKILKKSYEKMGINIVTHVMNPKSMPREQLLGLMNHDTREFNDGVLTASARQVVKESSDTICWIVCDGDIDPEWVESLNSVLDDNHLLTLPNGERISFGDNVNFIFETNDMKFASPATVTRLGMIFLSEEDVDVGRVTKTWINKQPQEMQNKLATWLDELFMPGLEWVLAKQKHLMTETTKVGTVNNALTYLNGVTSRSEFVYGVIIGLGSNFNLTLRKEFTTMMMSKAGERAPDPNPLLNYFDQKNQAWGNFVQDGHNLQIAEMTNPEYPPLIQTPAIQSTLAILKPLLNRDESFVLCGPEGCGKNLVITSLIKQMKSTQLAIINCNAQTSAFAVIQKLNQMCSQSTAQNGKVYRPKDCQRLIIYLKDINLPKPDKYDTIQLISFLQQIVCYRGFYDTNLDFVTLERIVIVASMNPSTTIGRHKITTRFTANVRLAYMEYPNQEDLVPVYNNYLKTVLTHPRLGGGKLANSTRRLATFLVDLFGDIRAKFSVDEHRHYLFTPRMLTQLLFQLLRYEIPDAQVLIETFMYESARVFRDRLVDHNSKRVFDQILYSHIQNDLKFKGRLQDIFFISKITKGQESIIGGLPNLGRIPKQDFITMLEGEMRAYEREYKELNLDIVDEVLDLITQIERVLSMPGGCLLLAGRAGVGRKQSTQLICHMLNAEFFSPAINREYSMKEFKRDLKMIMQKSGVDAEKCCLYIEDHQLINSEFLEMLNSLISAGEIPGLYTPEELEPILSSLQDEMRNQYECRTLFEFFVSRIKKHLSIVVSLDNANTNFQQMCAQNPSLFNKCQVIWSEGFSKESMRKIATDELEPVSGIIGNKMDEMINGALSLHASASNQFLESPASFMNLIINYRTIIQSISSASGGQSKHLIAGLEKLQGAQETVDKLSTEANAKSKVLAASKKEANKAMEKIQVSMEAKAARKTEVEALQTKCQADEIEIQKQKQMVEYELSHIQPEVDAAKALVGDLKSSNLNEIKNFRVPPDPVVHVLGAVMQFLGQGDTSWNAMKRFLSNSGVIQQIMNFDARSVTPGLRKKVQKIIDENPSSFEQSVIFNCSRAAAPLAAWCKANVKYSEVLLKIEPLNQQLDGLMQHLVQSQNRVVECTQQLEQLNHQTQQLQDNYQVKMTEAATLEADLKKAKSILEQASKLLSQLSGENERWKHQVKTLQTEMSLVPARSLVSSAYMTYLGSQNEVVRDNCMKEWLQMVRMQEFDFRNFLSSEAEMLTWKKEGLPADSLSTENAIMIMNSSQTPLVIDPATQATEWLQKSLRQKNENVEILNHQDSKFNTNIELAIRFGKILIVQEVDGIEAMLVPILRKDLMQQGPRQVVQLGDKAVDYNPAFRLYLTTRDQFVHVPPNIKALVTTINFTVTKSGLEGQLLSITINFEQPELEQRKTQLHEEEERLKIQLADFEKQLLLALANSTGDILENKTLIDSLNQTKAQSSQIEQALTESKNLQVSLDQQREVYRNFSVTGSNLFMVFGDLLKLNNMYQFSLNSFVKLFNRALETKPSASSTEEKLKKLSTSLIRLCYSEIGRSLFKADRLTYSLHFIKGVFAEMFGNNEWDFFNGKTAASTESAFRFPQWASTDRKEQFAMFCNTFGALAQGLQLDNDSMWRQFATSAQPEVEFPQQFQQKLSGFQRLILIQVFRPDRLESAMTNFVKEAFGGLIQPTPFSLNRIYDSDTTCADPILFIISPGSDPSSELGSFAEQVVGRSKYHELAMGGGQNEIAIETIKNAAEKGEWVCLKNLHLVTPWLSVLEKEFKMLKPDKNFRLWLTSEPHVKFPSILLQSSLKITYETPPGMKNNLQRTFQYVAPQGNSQEPNRMQLLFILSWFHALIQERRTYIPQGWVKYYEFSYGDLKAGESILSDILKENSRSIQWQKIYGILENAIYGGRVDNDYDMRVLRTYMRELFLDGTLQGQQRLSNMVQTPQTSNAGDVMGLINQLPENDNPNMFGLPSNIDRSVQRFNSNQVISGLKQLQAVSAQELRFDKEKWSEQLTPLCQLWGNIFNVQLFKNIKISSSDLRNPDPVSQFVFMEMMAVKRILGIVHESMQSIVKVLQGTEMLTPKTETEATALLKSQVPQAWEKNWEGPENPTQWMRTLCKKGVSMTEWVQKVQQQSLLNSPVNLGDLLHPETFLNAFRQKSARTFNVAIDELKLVSSFEQGKVGSNGAISIEGLWLQGCDFDGTKLTDIRSDAPEIAQLPVCYINWISKDQQAPYPEQSTVETPVYFNIDREKLLCTFQIANSGEKSTRIISGVALFLNGSD